MTPANAWSTDIDPLSLTAGFSILAGLLTLADPYFLGLTVALAALAASLWLARAVRTPHPRRVLSVLTGAGVVGAAWLPTLAAPTLVGRWAGTLLAAASLVLWMDARHAPGEGR